LGRWDVKTVSILLAHGGNPNFAYNHGAPGEKLSTPWQDMLLQMWKMDRGRAIDFTYRNDVSGKDIFTLLEILGQLFELLLRNGADPHAKSAPLYNHQSKHLESFSVSDVIKKLFKEHPDERARLLVLLKDLKVAEAPPLQPPKVQHRRGRISRLAAKLKFSTKGSKQLSLREWVSMTQILSNHHRMKAKITSGRCFLRLHETPRFEENSLNSTPHSPNRAERRR
jgi:hypothetical protein